MKTCPRCQSNQTWRLGDGRFKCRVCDARFSWRSVWDSVRLPDAAKQKLVDAFVRGVSVYRQRHDDDACVDSRERFYRLMRAVCALDARIPRAATYLSASHVAPERPRSCMRGWAATRVVMIIGISEDQGRIRIGAPPPAVAVEVLPLLRGRTAIGGVYRVHENHAFASLQVQGDHVVIQRMTRAPLAMNCIETFWDATRERLQVFRKIRKNFFYLYLGEMCFRFNHRDADLAVLLRELLQSTSSADIRAVLRGVSTQPQSVDAASWRLRDDDGDTRRRKLDA